MVANRGNMKYNLTMKIIRFKHTKYIHYQSKSTWDKGFFDVTFKEYNMQVQFYDKEGKSTYKELLKQDSNVIQLNYKMNTILQPYINMLNGVLIDVTDIAGKRFMKFNCFDVKIIDSQRNIAEKHLIEINYLSEPYAWLETIGNQLVIKNLKASNNEIFVVKLSRTLTLHSFQLNEQKNL